MRHLKLTIILVLWAAVMILALSFCVFCEGATFPTPIFPAYSTPLPVWTSETVTVTRVAKPVHTGQPIKQPKRVTHSWNQHGCVCPMCLGSHLVNCHGLTTAEWDVKGFPTNHAKATAYHRQLHSGAAVKPISQQAIQYVPPRRAWRRCGFFCRLRGG